MWFLSLQDRLPKLWKLNARFLIVAAFATLLDVALCTVLCLPFPKEIAYVVAFVTALLARFCLDRSFTFKSTDPNVAAQFLRYAACCFATLLTGLMIFRTLCQSGVTPLASKLISIPPVTVLGFLLFRFVVFRFS
jgi:putative flippase GtrA